jgi:formate hydrogenlyase subunit 6/NADH:ubiquinone oxidoreductase subunit I
MSLPAPGSYQPCDHICSPVAMALKNFSFCLSLCEGCVDICPWKCIHYLSVDAIDDSINVEAPDESEAPGFFVVDEEACTRCALCVDRCPTGVISLGKFAGSLADQAVQNGVYTAPWDEDSGERNDRHGYIYGRL